MKIIILCIALFSIIAFSGCLEENNVMNKDDLSEEDFEINAEWNNDFVPHFHTNSDINPLVDSNSIHDEFVLTVKSDYEGLLYYKVYDKLKGSELNLFYDNQVYDLDSQIVMNIYKEDRNNIYTINLDSFEKQKEIEVYFSLDENFNMKDEGVVKLSTFLPQRKVDFEVNPSTIKFTISKSISSWVNSRQITIKNTGDIILNIGVYPPPYYTNDELYPEYKPQYNRGNIRFGGVLKPSESKQYEIISTINYNGKFDTPINTYQTDLLIGTLFNDDGRYIFQENNKNLSDANYVKTFTLETTVIE